MSWKCPVDGTENQQDPQKPEPGEYLLMRLKTDIGKTLCTPFGDESGFWTDPQFTCEPPPKENPEDPWRIIPNTNATNETLLNGRTITAPQAVNAGDVLSVGRESKGVIKLPLLVDSSIRGIVCVGCGYVPFLVLKPISQEEARNIFSEKGMDTPIAEEAPAEEAPAEEAPAEEAPAEEAPAEEAPAEETPVEETPVEETPVEETPVEETPAEAAPAEETPAEETPVEAAEEVPAVEETPEPEASASGTMDVVITACVISTTEATKVLQEYKPDVRTFDIYKMLRDFPRVAFENQPNEEAETIKAKLEAAGCTVELRPHSG